LVYLLYTVTISFDALYWSWRVDRDSSWVEKKPDIN